MYGLMDFVVILVILVIIFGAKWLPAMGAAIGRALARRAAGRPQPPPAEERRP
jgi:Sec-independent protein translocase protein TatA